MEGGEACGARGFGRNGAEAEVRGELSSAAMATAGDEPGQGEERLGSGIGETERRKRTWLRWMVKRRRYGSTRRRVVVPATRRRGDGVATGKEEMVARAVL